MAQWVAPSQVYAVLFYEYVCMFDVTEKMGFELPSTMCRPLPALKATAIDIGTPVLASPSHGDSAIGCKHTFYIRSY